MTCRQVLTIVSWLTLTTAASAEVTHFVRFNDSGTMRYGVVDGDQVRVIDRAPWRPFQTTDRTVAFQAIRPAIPTEPSVVLGAAYNFRSHLGERQAPTEPQFFWKTPHSLIPHGQAIELPGGADNAHYEAELVLVIGRRIRNATLKEAEAAIFGYTCGNDVSERSWQKTDVQWWRAKGSRTFGPVGPVIVSGVDWKTLRIQGMHNGKLVQDEDASDMLFPPAQLVQYASRFVTLNPGDLIFTASPGLTTPLKPGDTYEVRIEPIGTLRNPVVTAAAPSERPSGVSLERIDQILVETRGQPDTFNPRN